MIELLMNLDVAWDEASESKKVGTLYQIKIPSLLGVVIVTGIYYIWNGQLSLYIVRLQPQIQITREVTTGSSTLFEKKKYFVRF